MTQPNASGRAAELLTRLADTQSELELLHKQRGKHKYGSEGRYAVCEEGTETLAAGKIYFVRDVVYSDGWVVVKGSTCAYLKHKFRPATLEEIVAATAKPIKFGAYVRIFSGECGRIVNDGPDEEGDVCIVLYDSDGKLSTSGEWFPQNEFTVLSRAPRNKNKLK